MKRSESEARVQALFDVVASGYDHPSASWFDDTATAIAEASKFGPVGRALDVATGTGKVALALATRAPAGEVWGVDLSAGMLLEAKRKAQRAALSNLTFWQCSFDEMSFDESFDLLTCSFGLFFVDGMAETLAHFAKQLRPGGRIVLSTFGLGSFSPFSDAFFRLYESFGFETRPASWLRIASDELLSALCHQAGLPAPVTTEHDFGFELESAAAWWDIVYNAGYRGMLLAMTEAQRGDFEEQHLRDVQALIDAGTNWLAVSVLIAVIDKAE